MYSVKRLGTRTASLILAPVRGASAASDFIWQMYANNGDIKKWNFYGTIGNACLKSPLLAAVSGTINFSWNSIFYDDKILPRDPEKTIKNIVFGTLGNINGDAASDILSSSGLGSYMDNLAAQLFGDGMSTIPTKEEKEK